MIYLRHIKMTSMLSSVSTWLGGARERSPERVKVTVTPEGEIQEQVEKVETATTEEVKDDESKPSFEADLQEVSEKAMIAAKEWGSYLYSFGKTATEQVVKTAKHFKDTVEEKTILGEFGREQEKFLQDQKDRKKQSEAAVPPWVGYNEEEIMKTQILNLSKEKRNFLRNPPTGVQFQFDYASFSPIANVMLEEDSNLRDMRFELVPKQITEEMFWRNYFYRVSLVKQSTQLTSLAQQTSSSTASSKSTTNQDTPAKSESEGAGDEDLACHSPSAGGGGVDSEFVSDTFQPGEDDIDNEELRKEMNQLGVNDKNSTQDDLSDDLPEWEKELQAELQEFEVVSEDADQDGDELEREIMKQIEAEVDKQ